MPERLKHWFMQWTRSIRSLRRGVRSVVGPVAAIGLLQFAQAQIPQAKILPLGDSLTRGNNDINYPNGDIPGGYRKELARKLASGGYSFDFVGTCSDNATAGVDPQHDGHPGYRTDEILANLPSYLSVQPDTVLLMVGTNDILQAKSVEVAAANLDTIIEKITANAPRRRLYVCTITPITQNWFGQSAGMLNAKVDAYNTDVRNIVQSKRSTGQNVFLVDMRNLIVLVGSSPAENFFQSGDGLHPGQAGYDQMGRIWFEAITTTGALLDVPATPFGLKATVVSPSRINLEWIDAAADETGFQIRRRVVPDGPWESIADLDEDVVNYAATGLTTGANSYAFAVRAKNSFGFSSWSIEVSTAAPENLAYTKPAGASSSLGDLHPGNANDGLLETSWNSGLGDTAPVWSVDLEQEYQLQTISLVMRQDADAPEQRRCFEVQAANDPSFSGYRVLAMRGAESLPHAAIWEVPVNDTEPYRYIRIAKTEAESLSLASVRVYGSLVPMVPQAPTGIKATLTETSTALISWTPASNNESAFKVERMDSAGGCFAEVSMTNAASVSYSDTCLAAHTRYFYRVIATNEAGDSIPSPAISIATGPASSYENWTGSFPEFTGLPESDRLASADPNRDGWTNLMAYALGVSPLSQVPAEAMPHIVVVPGTNPPELVFRFRRHLASSDLEYEVLSAAEPDSGNWSMLPLDNARFSAVAGNQLMEEVSVPMPSSAGAAHFFRLRVVKNDSSE